MVHPPRTIQPTRGEIQEQIITVQFDKRYNRGAFTAVGAQHMTVNESVRGRFKKLGGMCELKDRRESSLTELSEQ